MMARRLFPALVTMLVLSSCSLIEDSTSSGPPSTTTTSTAPAGTTAPLPTTTEPPATLPSAPPGLCDSYVEGATTLGTVANGDVTEASGIAASRRYPGTIWMHNDSGSDPIVYAVAEDGSSLGSAEIDVPAFDWEDMALGPGPDPGIDYLYLGDIGDNLHFRPVITVYRIPEPDPNAAPTFVTAVDTFNLRYPEPGPDSEALLVDPITGDILVITKDDSGGLSVIFRAPAAALIPGGTTDLVQVGTFDLEPGTFVTAADIDGTGAVVAFRGYNEVWMWNRTELDFGSTFAAEPCRTPSTAEIQGEAISFAATGFGYFTVSEGSNPDINFVASSIEP